VETGPIEPASLTQFWELESGAYAVEMKNESGSYETLAGSVWFEEGLAYTLRVHERDGDNRIDDNRNGTVEEAEAYDIEFDLD
jgi:hypothetical protein